MTTQYVYLCGPITGLSYGEARYGWRELVKEALESKLSHVKCLSPMRAKNHLRDVESLSPMGDPSTILSSPRGITTRDRWDVQRSSLIFCNLLGYDKISVGSMIEFGWADAWRKPIICCVEPDAIHQHAMFTDLIGWECPTLEEGIAVARAVLTENL